MALVGLGGMNYSIVGGIGSTGSLQRPIAVTSITQDAALEAAIMIGRLIWEGGGTHTVDTTLSSRLEFRTAAVTFANVGTSFSVGLAAVDTTNGPPGRAVNVADAITFDVSWVGLGNGGGITANAWQSKTPTIGSKAIASGDFVAFCTQMVTRAGADSVLTNYATIVGNSNRPTITGFTGGAYVSAGGVPNCVVIASDGTRGYFYGGCAVTSALASLFNSASTPNERGNLIVLPGPARVIGIEANVNATGPFDLVFYSDALGTPVARGTASIDENTISANTSNMPLAEWFTPYDAVAGTYAVVCKPGATNVTLNGLTLNNANYQNVLPLGVNGNAVNRSSGAFAQQNSGLDRYGIGIIIEGIDAGGGGGPVGQQCM